MRSGVRKVETISFPVSVSRRDIEEGQCGLANKCMVRVATERMLRKLDSDETNHHTRVDAGHIRFNYKGHRYLADTPKLAKASLIKFDLEAKARAKAKRTGTEFTSKVEPFSFKVVAARGSKIAPQTAQRREQINNARQKRVEAGQKPKQYTLRKRVAGFA